MPERPLVLFAEPSVADKEKKSGGPDKFNKPSYDRQIARLAPKFAELQHALDQGNVKMTTTANAIEPEYTLVFETVGEPSGFFTAINTLKEQYPEVEWIMELSGSCPSDDDFYAMNKNGERNNDKLLSTKIFCIMTNQKALAQILSLWHNYKTNINFKFDRGLTGFKHLFCTLKDVHKWGTQERIEDTGLLEYWTAMVQDSDISTVRTQIELFYRTSEIKRTLAEHRVTDLIESIGGKVIMKSNIPEIQYHALLAEIPKESVQLILNKEEVDLIVADEIMFMKGVGQAISVGTAEASGEIVPCSKPKRIFNEPIIALFDGMPQENHPLLSDLLIVDDPDSIGVNSVNERIHGTSMASLILRGQSMDSIKEDVYRIYVRPIMESRRNFHNKVEEYIPDDFLLVDKIHECVRRLFETSAGRVAPSVRVINLSIGIANCEYYNIISPFARLLDWLSYKYRVLFIISAGNHPDDLNLKIDFSTFTGLKDSEKDKIIYKYIEENLRNLRFLSPAESMNSLTVGAIFADNNDAKPLANMTTVCSNGLPAVYGSFGRGINNAIKPDILYCGGRSFIRENIINHEMAEWVNSIIRKPGVQSAYPSLERIGDGITGYTFGTSNSAALISNQAAECYDIINNVFIAETGEQVPYDYTAVILKAMLAHGASWHGLAENCKSYLGLFGKQTKSKLHKFLGYGVADIDKVKECTKNQITLIGYGDIKQNQAFVYSIPLPFDFHAKKCKRKLIVTLAYFSPIHPSSIKYREKQLWFTINNGKNIAGGRTEYDDKAVQRGTLQHEVFESDSIEVWDESDELTIKVNCRGDASSSDGDVLIPYSLFATFEMAPESDIDVYQSVLEKISTKNIIVPNIK